MFSSHKAPISIISFLTLITTLLGCPVNKGENMLVRKLDAVLLTTNDLPTMEVDGRVNFRTGGMVKEPPVVDGFIQIWHGTHPQDSITVSYWLFQSVADAQKAADVWRDLLSARLIVVNGEFDTPYQPEPNAEDVIGDATWRVANKAHLWFVKNNVLVHIKTGRDTLNHQRTLARSVARKIETKINTALSQP